MSTELPLIRFEVTEAARILRICRALLYKRIKEGQIKAQKDGRRTYVSAAELHRYVASLDGERSTILPT